MRFLPIDCRKLLVCVVLAFFPLSVRGGDFITTDKPQRISYGVPSGLPLPSTKPIREFEELLFDFVRNRKYIDLGWHGDKGVRDTGPFIRGWNYGTHHTVRIFYSPELMKWLTNGRGSAIPDGTMVIKEQFGGKYPAAAFAEKSESEIVDAIKAWTVMIKDSNGSHDGWFWSNPLNLDDPPKDNHEFPFDHRESGFGMYCIRCHAVTESPGDLDEYTFSHLRNVKGFPGHPVLFRVDHSWRALIEKSEQAKQKASPDELSGDEVMGSHPRCTASSGPSSCPTQRNADFLSFFTSIEERGKSDVRAIPPVTHDWVVRAPSERAAAQAFVTSNQCMSCHAGLLGEFGPVMFVHTEDVSTYPNGTSKYKGDGIDYSPYGEWRWTPMGLAGRDPIFYAQLDTELAILKKEFADDPAKQEMISKKLVNTCLRCHGAMGKHQFQLDQAAKGNHDAHFSLEHVYSHGSVHDLQTRAHQYGALARDGISCTVCHRMQPREQPLDDNRPYLQYFLETSITGNFHLGPPHELYGPFKDDEIAPYAMEHGIGFKPKYSAYISSSQMCGTCHTVNLPIVDYPFHPDEPKNELAEAESVPEFRDFHHHVEQATYLEWLNSEYENEFNPANPKARTCQDCHMSRDLQSPKHGIDIANLETQIAIIQDATYPDAENLPAHEKLHVRVRKEGYARHNFSGLNIFLLEMFNQFDDILGVRKRDYMTGTEQIPNAVENFKLIASEKTGDIAVRARESSKGQLEATVLVESNVGHRFPSGVGFRRAFLELLVLDKSKQGEDAIVWGSGRTNNLGVIVDGDDEPLKTEFLARDSSGDQQYQPHHAVISAEDQVQIYETLLYNRSDEFTTSFIHGCTTVKDNRLLPRGWSEEGPDPSALTGYFLKATQPVGKAKGDPRYQDGSGSDETTYRIKLPQGIGADEVTVRATLYYQAIPPYFLKTIFDTAPDSEAAQRLHYICSNLNLDGTPIEDWKFQVVSAECDVLQSTPR